MKIDEIRKQQYLYHKDHDRSPYTWFKAKFYMEGATRLVYLLQGSRVHPNVLTLSYGLLGVIGGVLLSVPNKISVFIALAIFFTKGILDWSDGHLARLTGKVTKYGQKLDILAGRIGTIAFYLGVAMFLVNHYGVFIVLWFPIVLYPLKRLGYPISRACIVDYIILLVGIINLHLTF